MPNMANQLIAGILLSFSWMATLVTPGQTYFQMTYPPCVWSTPVNLSETPDQNSRHGAIVGDAYGQVHAFWTERDNGPTQGRDYVAYRYMADGQWSPVADILLSPPNGWASMRNGAALADSEWLYLAWEDNLGINVSMARIGLAGNAREWFTTRLFTGPTVSPAIRQASDGTLHVLYVGSQYLSLFHTLSTDAGATWSEPGEVWATASADQAIAQPSIYVGSNGTLHATWQVNVRTLDWTPSGIRYTRSLDNGLTWAEPVSFEDAAGGDPLVTEDTSSGKVFLMWNGRAGTIGGRFYAWSDDGGKSWSGMRRRSEYIGGLNGRPSLLTDSLGRNIVMFTAALQSNDLRTFPLAAFLNGIELGQPALLSEESGFNIGGDSPAFGISGGNRLHALLWTQEQNAGEILYANCLLDAPPTGIMSRLSQTTRSPTATPVTRPTPATYAATPARTFPTMTAAPPVPVPGPQQNAFTPIVVSAIASLVVVGAISGWLLRSRKG